MAPAHDEVNALGCVTGPESRQETYLFIYSPLRRKELRELFCQFAMDAAHPHFSWFTVSKLVAKDREFESEGS